MKKMPKVINLFMIAGLLTACNVEERAPTLLGLDLSDAVLVFCGNDCTGLHNDENGMDINEEGILAGRFLLRKTNSEGVTTRVHCRTSKSDDDKFYTEDDFFTNLVDISEDYFYADFGSFGKKSYRFNKYFINKKTGDALKFPDGLVFNKFDWIRSLTPLNYFPKDSAGNIYGIAYSYETHEYGIVKFSIAEKEVKAENIANIEDMNPNLFAVDKDGNVVFNTGRGQCFVRTADGELIKQSLTSGLFWTAYDGNIYSYESGNVSKLTYNKDEKKFTSTVVKTIDSLSSLYKTAPEKLLYLDGLKQIYTYRKNENKDLVLYQLYSETAAEEPITFSAADFGMTDGNERDYCLFCDNDSIVSVLNKTITTIDVKDNMKVTKHTLPIQYNDGMRMLNNKKMAVFYWNEDSEINCPPDTDYALMSIGLYDFSNGTLSKQDKFVSGNADRSHVINLK